MCCAAALQQEHNALLSGVVFSLVVVLVWGFWFELEDLVERIAELCYDCGSRLVWACGGAHMSFVVPFDNQYVCLFFYDHCHRMVIFSICLLVFAPCSGNECETGNENLTKMKSFAVGGQV